MRLASLAGPGIGAGFGGSWGHEVADSGPSGRERGWTGAAGLPALPRSGYRLEEAEGVCAADEGLAGRAVLFQGPDILHFAFEDFGMDSSKTAQQPLVVVARQAIRTTFSHLRDSHDTQGTLR